MKIFIPAGGGQIGHIKALQQLSEVSEVIISDADDGSYGNFIADRSYRMPRFQDPGFWDNFEQIYAREKFDVCLPLHDASLELFSSKRDYLAKYPFFLALNSSATIELICDKERTHAFFMQQEIPTARQWILGDIALRGPPEFPVYIKPRNIALRGTSVQFYMKVEDSEDYLYALRKLEGREEDYVVQQYLSGQEINLDIFCDATGELRKIVALKRLAMGANRGITRGEIISNTMFEPFVKKICAAAKFWGANQVQAFVEPDGRILFTEINGRFSRSSVFVKEAGVNYFHYLIQLIKGNQIAIEEEPRKLLMNSWDKHFYFEESPLLNP